MFETINQGTQDGWTFSHHRYTSENGAIVGVERYEKGNYVYVIQDSAQGRLLSDNRGNFLSVEQK